MNLPLNSMLAAYTTLLDHVTRPIPLAFRPQPTSYVRFIPLVHHYSTLFL